MRQIKFRAWSGRDKCWCSAFSIHKSGLFSEIINAHIVMPQIMAVADAHWQDLSKKNPDDIVVTQFTGLLDKNGKEVYEGDIIRFTKIGDSFCDYGKIVYLEEKAMYMIQQLDNNRLVELYNDTFGKVEIIGDIYSTPNLLN